MSGQNGINPQAQNDNFIFPAFEAPLPPPASYQPDPSDRLRNHWVSQPMSSPARSISSRSSARSGTPAQAQAFSGPLDVPGQSNGTPPAQQSQIRRVNQGQAGPGPSQAGPARARRTSSPRHAPYSNGQRKLDELFKKLHDVISVRELIKETTGCLNRLDEALVPVQELLNDEVGQHEQAPPVRRSPSNAATEPSNSQGQGQAPRPGGGSPAAPGRPRPLGQEPTGLTDTGSWTRSSESPPSKSGPQSDESVEWEVDSDGMPIPGQRQPPRSPLQQQQQPQAQAQQQPPQPQPQPQSQPQPQIQPQPQPQAQCTQRQAHQQQQAGPAPAAQAQGSQLYALSQVVNWEAGGRTASRPGTDSSEVFTPPRSQPALYPSQYYTGTSASFGPGNTFPSPTPGQRQRARTPSTSPPNAQAPAQPAVAPNVAPVQASQGAPASQQPPDPPATKGKKRATTQDFDRWAEEARNAAGSGSRDQPSEPPRKKARRAPQPPVPVAEAVVAAAGTVAAPQAAQVSEALPPPRAPARRAANPPARVQRTGSRPGLRSQSQVPSGASSQAVAAPAPSQTQRSKPAARAPKKKAAPKGRKAAESQK